VLSAPIASLQRGIAPIGPLWKAVLVGGMTFALVYAVVRTLGSEWPVQVLAVTGTLLAWHLSRDRPAWRFAVVSAAAAVAAFLLLEILDLAQDRVVNPPFFDYTVFWILGRASHVPGPIFDPTTILEIGRAVGAPEAFFDEVRPFYPPPFYLLIGPLGLMDLSAAALPWYLVQINAMLVAIVAVWRCLLAREGLPGLVLAAVLVLAMPAATATMNIGQTNFILLALAVVLFCEGDKRLTGVAIAIGAVVKPFFGILLLIPIARRHVRALIAAVISGVVLAVLAAIVLGPQAWIDFFTTGLGHLSSYPFSQAVNQSLPAGLIRIVGSAPDVVLLVVAVVVVTIIVFVAQLLAAAESATTPLPQGLFTAMLLLTTLLLYPATLSHYYLLLVAPLGYVWSQRERMPLSPIAIALLVGLVYGLVGFDRGRMALLGGIVSALLVAGILAAGLGWLPDRSRLPAWLRGPAETAAASARTAGSSAAARVRSRTRRNRDAT
jgi:hypothetical protein